MSQPQSDVAHQNNDIVLKIIAAAFGADFFRRFGLALAPIIAGLPAEFPQLAVRTREVDLLFRLADGAVLHLEFQTQRRLEDLLRFAEYHLAIYKQYGGPVYTVVIYGAGIRSAPAPLTTGSVVFSPTNILLGRQNGAAVLAALEQKVARGDTLTATDRIDLILLPLMGHRRRPRTEVLRKAATLARALPREQQELTVGALLGLAYHYIGEETVTAILEELSMVNPLQTLLLEREARGEARGTVEGKRASIKTVLRTRFGVDALPEGIERRIDGAGEDDLDMLLRRATAVDALDAL